jgi:hypothetical protein
VDAVAEVKEKMGISLIKVQVWFTL